MSIRAAGCVAMLVLVSWAAWPAHAGPPSAPESPVAAASAVGLAGRYHLEGMRETGSELLLQADGSFRWYLAYGALDLEAEGHWQRKQDNVVLVPDLFRFPPQYPQMEFKRMQLRIDDGDLIPAWPWDDGAERGRYTRD